MTNSGRTIRFIAERPAGDGRAMAVLRDGRSRCCSATSACSARARAAGRDCAAAARCSWTAPRCRAACIWPRSSDGATVDDGRGARDGWSAASRFSRRSSRSSGFQCGFCTPGFILMTKELLGRSIRIRPTTRFATTCPAICAGARRIRTSSKRSRWRQRQEKRRSRLKSEHGRRCAAPRKDERSQSSVGEPGTMPSRHRCLVPRSLVLGRDCEAMVVVVRRMSEGRSPGD